MSFKPSKSFIDLASVRIKSVKIEGDERSTSQARFLVLAKIVLGPKTSSEELLKTTVKDLLKTASLRGLESSFTPRITKLGLEESDYLYKSRLHAKNPVSRMTLWRLFSKIEKGLLVSLRALSQKLMNEITQFVDTIVLIPRKQIQKYSRETRRMIWVYEEDETPVPISDQKRF